MPGLLPAAVFATLVALAQAAAPPGADLRSVPLPPDDALEPAVADHLRTVQRDLDAASRDGRDRAALGAAYGAAAQVFHAYEFLDSAEAAYLNAIRLGPDDARWRHLLAYLYLQVGRFDEAADQLEAVRRLEPDRREAIVYLAQANLALNRLGEARRRFEEILGVFPAVARSGLGEIALRERRFAEAIAHLGAALARAPDATALHYSLAMAYRALGRLDEARAHLERRGTGVVRAADPLVDTLQALVRGERLLVIQGRRAYEAGDFEAAAQAFSRALAAAPGSVAAHAGLGILLAREGRDREAADHLRRAFGQAPDDTRIRTALIGALLRLGRHDEAVDTLRAARAVDPDNEDLVVGLSILLAGRDRYREAVALLADANRRFPERPATATTLARLLASSPDRALRDGARALALASRVYAADATPAHAETVALALAELGRCGEALEWMRRAMTQAEGAQDAEELARLRGELPQYEGGACRAGPVRETRP